MATLDLHVEAPAQSSHAAFSRPEDQARFIFNKTIAGHYRNGRDYEKVGVLLLTWEGDDMDCKTNEVKRLQDIFEKRLHYTTDVFEIPSERSETGLQRKIADFAHEYNQPNNLMILYYGGHAYRGSETRALKLAAKEAGDGDGDPRAFFNDILNTLRLPDTDILVIIDCCYAGKAFANGELGKRKFELLASVSLEEMALGPSKEGSFTKILADVLDDLLDGRKYSKGFSTSTLYREIYHHAKLKYKPYLFDQSRYDYGKIWLRPLPVTSGGTSAAKKGDITIDLTLHLTQAPNGLMINDLAKALQYLPHVQEVDLARLHAPERDIKALYLSLQRLRYLLRWIRRVRTRQREKETLTLQRQGFARKHGRSFFALLEKQHYSSLYDWNNAVAFLKNGTSIPVQKPSSSTSPRRDSGVFPSQDEQSSAAKVHSFLGLLSIAYSLDLSNTRAFVGRLFTTSKSKRSKKGGYPVNCRSNEEPPNHAVDHSVPAIHVPSMVSVVDQAMVQYIPPTTWWEISAWVMILLGLAAFCYVEQE